MRYIAIIMASLALAACSMTSSIMDTGAGTYAVTGQASPLRGGSEEAGHGQAVAFCGANKHPIVLGITHPDLSNKVEMHFRCE